jgi:glycosyltransferase XagB
MKKIVIVLPTYNERENIGKLLQVIMYQRHSLPFAHLSVLVVDDSSPDGTAEVVREYARIYPDNIHLLSGQKRGLGAAYIRGFRYAMREMQADVLFEMDADFSHDPNDIPRFVKAIADGADFVIGSRYMKGGSIPDTWSKLRRLNSMWGNIFARKIAGITGVTDCTGGFRAIRASLLRQINFKRMTVAGYAFQINLLHEAIEKGAIVREIPIVFIDRQKGESKIRFSDISEFVVSTFMLRFLPVRLLVNYSTQIAVSLSLIIISFGIIYFTHLTTQSVFITLFFGLSLIMIIQGIFNLISMLYAWEDPLYADEHKSPTQYIPPKYAFTALVPARHEASVVRDTIAAIDRINYPEHLKETLIICQSDDRATMSAVSEAIALTGKENIRLVTFSGFPVNKPHSLNVGLARVSKNVVVVFDAEDEPHADIYRIANTVMVKKKADVLQSGVQLMNYNSRWFSTLNVLEYFFWFKSTLQFFAKNSVIPLGGNTVFFKKKWLLKVGGWDETCLTEDGEIGLRLSMAGARIRVVYDEEHATREETPTDLATFIRQRTRWNQGFLQIILKGDWMGLPIKQQLMAGYILLWSAMQAVIFLLVPVSAYLLLSVKLPVIFAIIMNIPLYILLLQIVVLNVGLFEFTRDYKLPYKWHSPFMVTVMFFPYQIILGYSALRAIYRQLKGSEGWEKTLHLNLHREPLDLRPIWS